MITTTIQENKFNEYVLENGLFLFSKLNNFLAKSEEQEFSNLLSKLSQSDTYFILNNPNELFYIYDDEKYYTAKQEFYGNENYSITLVSVSSQKPNSTLVFEIKGEKDMQRKSRFDWIKIAYPSY